MTKKKEAPRHGTGKTLCNFDRLRQCFSEIYRQHHQRGFELRKHHLQTNLRRLDEYQEQFLERRTPSNLGLSDSAILLHDGEKCHRLRNDHRRDGHFIHGECRRLLHRLERLRLHKAGGSAPGIGNARHRHGREKNAETVYHRLQYLQIHRHPLQGGGRRR